MPTSVLLAVLAAAGLLALAPALVRRYDATERLAAERAMSTARVLSRHRRRRTVPGRRPINLPRQVLVTVPAPISAPPAPPKRNLRLVTRRPPRRIPARRHTPAVVRRRRVFAALLLLNVIELIGVLAVGTLSIFDKVAFPDDTVWSGYGSGYGYVPLVLPFIGLWWLHRNRPPKLT